MLLPNKKIVESSTINIRSWIVNADRTSRCDHGGISRRNGKRPRPDKQSYAEELRGSRFATLRTRSRLVAVRNCDQRANEVTRFEKSKCRPARQQLIGSAAIPPAARRLSLPTDPYELRRSPTVHRISTTGPSNSASITAQHRCHLLAGWWSNCAIGYRSALENRLPVPSGVYAALPPSRAINYDNDVCHQRWEDA
jgi:hypothetical protein